MTRREKLSRKKMVQQAKNAKYRYLFSERNKKAEQEPDPIKKRQILDTPIVVW